MSMYSKTKNTILRYRKLSIIFLALLVGLGASFFGRYQIADVLFISMSLWVLIPLTIQMIKELFNKQYGLDILAVIAVSASLLLGEYVAAIVIVLMIESGQALEDYAQEHAKKELSELLKRAPKITHKKQGETFVDISVDSVAIGDILLIKPGELVPVDSHIIEGSSSIDESALTGESMPVDKSVGDVLLSGGINQQSAITVIADKTSKESQYEQIVAMVSSAASSKSPFVRMADMYSVPFTIVSLAIAGLAWYLSGESQRALEVLVLATPCPLLIATPVALVSGISKGARKGIIFKHGAALEKLANAKMVALDKTGTLTIGIPAVHDVVSFSDEYSVDEVAAIAAGVESNSTHTLAVATLDYAKNKQLQIPTISDAREDIGSGVKAVYSNLEVIVGKAVYLSSQGVSIDDVANKLVRTSMYVAVDKLCIGAISFSDKKRPDAKRTLEALKLSGINNFAMLTGDRKIVADEIATEIGITHVRAECLPADKLAALHEFKKNYSPIVFVGDGINDAPSLAAADVGIALGARGSTAASEAADVVIMLDVFYKIADAVAVSKRTIMIAKQSIFLGIGLSVALMIVAGVTGLIKPVYGALLQELVDVLVIGMALRAHK
ncbi:cadmium-translocating P-type ATPase [Candidatus Saccharibacteria bacterium]|nr:cadmium-translocating P-type ATPase [Candidatus Saccharibacteria bacterium]